MSGGVACESTPCHIGYGLSSGHMYVSSKTKAALDHEADDSYIFMVTVSDKKNQAGDADTEVDDTITVTITVNDVNEPPVIDQTGPDAQNFAEIEFDVDTSTLTAMDYQVETYTATDPDAGFALTWSVSGTDSGSFTIDSTGQLSFGIRPDFENPVDEADSMMIGADDNVYKIVVEVKDGLADSGNNANAIDDMINVTVRVTDVNETPEVPAGAADETFMEIEYDASSADIDVAEYIPRDEEDDPEDLTWSLDGEDADDFEITKDATTGVGTLSFQNRPDFETPSDDDDVDTDDPDNVYEVTVQIGDGTNTRDYPLTVTVTDVNERPDIEEDFEPPQTYMEIEYDSTGTRPDVHDFKAEDYDDGDTFTWSLDATDADASDFQIDIMTGVLTFAQNDGLGFGPLPNFEQAQDDGADNAYAITVIATDNHGKAEEYEVSITVTDVNERPEFTGTPLMAEDWYENVEDDGRGVLRVDDYDARDEEAGSLGH